MLEILNQRAANVKGKHRKIEQKTLQSLVNKENRGSNGVLGPQLSAVAIQTTQHKSNQIKDLQPFS
jgi:hypothetical protein